jgi:pimeloyl-ACP methyl ester carboxylesterase
MRTIVIVHGAWSGGWSWRRVKERLEGRGFRVFTPTLTGVGERAHLARPEVDLELHIQDVAAVLEYEGLGDVLLVGHSYGGMVVTGVADRSPERLAGLVYVDAFVPSDGQSALDLLPPAVAEGMRARVAAEGDGWRLPPNPPADDTAPEDLAWLAPRRGPQPFATFTQKLRLEGTPPPPLRAYIYCERTGPVDSFGPFARRAQQEPGWRYFGIDASHAANVTAPAALTDLLAGIAATSPAARP